MILSLFGQDYNSHTHSRLYDREKVERKRRNGEVKPFYKPVVVPVEAASVQDTLQEAPEECFLASEVKTTDRSPVVVTLGFFFLQYLK